jgi:hypothetical protein
LSSHAADDLQGLIQRRTQFAPKARDVADLARRSVDDVMERDHAARANERRVELVVTPHALVRVVAGRLVPSRYRPSGDHTGANQRDDVVSDAVIAGLA